MNSPYGPSYIELSDKQIVDRILAIPHDEDGAVFLLYTRYSPLLHKEFNIFNQEDYWYDDCVDELFLHLRGWDGEWYVLKSFEWRSTFASWLKSVARRKFKESLQQLIKNQKSTLSIDNKGSEEAEVQIPDGGVETHERYELKIIVLEAIRSLKDDDQRFVVLKKLQGYKSKEIAILLQKKWQKLNIKKYNKKGELIIPNEVYANNLFRDARKELKEILVTLM